MLLRFDEFFAHVWTGAAGLLVPEGDAQIIHNLIKGAKSDGEGGFTVPCTFQDSLALTIGGRSFSIDPRDIATMPVNSSEPQGDCVSGISSSDPSDGDPPNQWLVSCHDMIFRIQAIC